MSEKIKYDKRKCGHLMGWPSNLNTTDAVNDGHFIIIISDTSDHQLQGEKLRALFNYRFNSQSY